MLFVVPLPSVDRVHDFEEGGEVGKFGSPVSSVSRPHDAMVPTFLNAPTSFSNKILHAWPGRLVGGVVSSAS